MTPERWTRVKEVFGAALERRTRDRAALVADACGDDDEVRLEVERLLDQHTRATAFLEIPAAAHTPSDPVSSTTPGSGCPDRIGPYRVLEALGEGGMGTVYLAEQDHPRRTVALKVLRGGAASESTIRRFEHEAQALARLQHPGIAQVYEAGTSGSGPDRRPYFAMELVRGRPLTEFAERHALGIRRRIELLIQVAEAVQHAHIKGVIHRDLKPANILVVEEEETERRRDEETKNSSLIAHRSSRLAQPKVLDFGVARLTDSDLRVTTHRTGAGQLVGTIPYMSPEQVAGDPLGVDTRSDVYALGVILFELLTRRLPHDVENKSLAEAARVIQDSAPSRLSRADRSLRGDLETIAGKALEKDKHRRYQSAADFAGDLRRYLASEPILARPPTTFYQLRKFAARNRVLVTAAAVVAAVLFAGVVGVTIQWDRARAEARRARAAEEEALSRLNTAGTAIGLMVDFTEGELANLPGATRARLKLAEQSRDQVLRLAVGDEAARRMRQIVAYAHQRVGEVKLVMGRVTEARDSFRASVAARETDLATNPDDPEARRSLAVGRWKLFEVAMAAGRLDDALADARFSAEAFQAIAAESGPAGSPNQARWEVYLGIAHRRLGEALAADGRHAEAAPHFAAAVERFDRAIGRPAGRPGSLTDRDLAESHLGLAEVRTATGEPRQRPGGLRRGRPLPRQRRAQGRLLRRPRPPRPDPVLHSAGRRPPGPRPTRRRRHAGAPGRGHRPRSSRHRPRPRPLPPAPGPRPAASRHRAEPPGG